MSGVASNNISRRLLHYFFAFSGWTIQPQAFSLEFAEVNWLNFNSYTQAQVNLR